MMAKQVHALAVHIVERYDGDAARVWTDATTSDELRANIAALPGFGTMKVKALGSVLAKRFGVALAEPLIPWHPTLGDVDSAEALADYQASKKVSKEAWSRASRRRRLGAVPTVWTIGYERLLPRAARQRAARGARRARDRRALPAPVAAARGCRRRGCPAARRPRHRVRAPARARARPPTCATCSTRGGSRRRRPRIARTSRRRAPEALDGLAAELRARPAHGAAVPRGRPRRLSPPRASPTRCKSAFPTSGSSISSPTYSCPD